MSCCKVGLVDFESSAQREKAKAVEAALREGRVCEDHLVLLLQKLPDLFALSHLVFDGEFVEKLLAMASREQVKHHVQVEEFLDKFLDENSSPVLLRMVWNMFLSETRCKPTDVGALVEKAKSGVSSSLVSGFNRLFVWLSCSQDRSDVVQVCISIPSFWPMLSFWFEFSNSFTEQQSRVVGAGLSESLLEHTEDGRLDYNKLRMLQVWRKSSFAVGSFKDEFVWRCVREQECVAEATWLGLAAVIASTLPMIEDRANAATRLFSVIFDGRLTTDEICEYDTLKLMRSSGMLNLVRKETILDVLSRPVVLDRKAWSVFGDYASLLDMVPCFFSADLLIDWMKKVAVTRKDYEISVVSQVPLVIWQNYADETCIMRIIEHAPQALWADHLATAVCAKFPNLLFKEQFIALQAESSLWNTRSMTSCRYVLAGSIPQPSQPTPVGEIERNVARKIVWSLCGHWKASVHLCFPQQVQQFAETVILCLKRILLKDLTFKIIELATTNFDVVPVQGGEYLMAIYELVKRAKGAKRRRIKD